MVARRSSAARRYRVWIVARGSWEPSQANDVPPAGVALEPAEEATMSAAEAACYVEAFNRAAQTRKRPLWAVALPVTVRYEGEPRPGELVGSRLSADRQPE